MRRSGARPHPCRVNFSGCNHLAGRLWPLVRHFANTSTVRNSFLFLLALTSVLPVASPQQTGGGSNLPVASPQQTGDGSKRSTQANQQDDNRQTLVTNFPQLPYQGSPPELPQDQGVLGLRLMLRRLSTTARLMQTVAHPDDEDGGMLTLESRGHGTSVLLMTLNRGEGGQNKIGSNLSDVLGVLRTEELLALAEMTFVKDGGEPRTGNAHLWMRPHA